MNYLRFRVHDTLFFSLHSTDVRWASLKQGRAYHGGHVFNHIFRGFSVSMWFYDYTYAAHFIRNIQML